MLTQRHIFFASPSKKKQKNLQAIKRSITLVRLRCPFYQLFAFTNKNDLFQIFFSALKPSLKTAFISQKGFFFATKKKFSFQGWGLESNVLIKTPKKS